MNGTFEGGTIQQGLWFFQVSNGHIFSTNWSVGEPGGGYIIKIMRDFKYLIQGLSIHGEVAPEFSVILGVPSGDTKWYYHDVAVHGITRESHNEIEVISILSLKYC